MQRKQKSADNDSRQNIIRPRFFDYCFFLLSLAVLVFSVFAAKNSGGSKPMLVIDSPGGQYVYSLSVDAEYSVVGKIGVSKIRVSGGKVFFVSSPCPNKTCIQCAPVSRNGEWIACLPNGVFVRVESNGSDDVDAVAF